MSVTGLSQVCCRVGGACRAHGEVPVRSGAHDALLGGVRREEAAEVGGGTAEERMAPQGGCLHAGVRVERERCWAGHIRYIPVADMHRRGGVRIVALPRGAVWDVDVGCGSMRRVGRGAPRETARQTPRDAE